MSPTALIAAGGYSRSGRGRGPGLEILRLSREDPAAAPAVARLAVVDLPDPSFVLWSRDGSLLYAVLETEPTRVVAVRVSADGESAEIVADLAVHGHGGCHLAHGADSSALVIALTSLTYIICGVTNTTNQLSSLENAAASGLITEAEKLTGIEQVISSVGSAQINGLFLCMTLLPFVLMFISFVLYQKKYTLDEPEYERICAELAAREAKA